MLLLGEGTEEVDLVLAGGAPLVPSFEGAFEVRLNVHIESLGLKLTIRGVVNAGYRLCA